MRVAMLAALAACGPGDDDLAFRMLGEVADSVDPGSTIGLWVVTSPEAYTYKFGSGASLPPVFDLEFRSDPPPEAIDESGIGVALVGNLPGIATLPDGKVDLATLQLIGLSRETAIIFKTPGAAGTSWSADFPDGYSCGFCVREDIGPDRFAPVDCTFVTIELSFLNPCVWY